MSLTFTPDALRAAYNFLNETPPFNRWNLPDGDDVEFVVARDRNLRGWHVIEGDKHTIAVSSAAVGHTVSLMATVAHEMVHLHERGSGSCSSTGHSAAFRKWAEQVCRVHGWDVKAF